MFQNYKIPFLNNYKIPFLNNYKIPFLNKLDSINYLYLYLLFSVFPKYF